MRNDAAYQAATAAQGYQGLAQGLATSGLQSSATGAPVPGTLPAIVLRLERVIQRANAVSGHSYEVRVGLVGTYPNRPDEKSMPPRSVPNGFIEQANEALDSIEAALSAADEHLEAAYSKIGS